MIQFFAPDILLNPELPESESLHCSRVLRMKNGDEIFVTDGKGSRFRCLILNSHPSHTSLSIISKEKIETEKSYSLTLAVAPTKNSERMEWMVEKAVEIGVDRIVLLKCERSERKNQKTDRLKKIMVSAMKQSLSLFLPEITELINYKDFICNCSGDAQKFFGYCSKDFPLKDFAKECKAGGEVIVMIGPEGDFTLEEVDQAIKNNFIPVTFGNKRLRTETAGVYACCAVNVINQIL